MRLRLTLAVLQQQRADALTRVRRIETNANSAALRRSASRLTTAGSSFTEVPSSRAASRAMRETDR